MNNIKARPSYSDEYKEKLIKRMLPPENIAASQLVKETGVAKSTLSKWLKKKNEEKIKSQKKVEWVTVNVNENASKIEKRNSPVKVQIGVVTIEVNEGFNSNLLLEVMKVVRKI